MIVVRRFLSRNENKLQKVNGIVAGGLDRSQGLRQRPIRPRRETTFIGVRIDDPVRIQGSCDLLLALVKLVEAEDTVERKMFHFDNASAAIALGDGNGIIRRTVIDDIHLYTLCNIML